MDNGEDTAPHTNKTYQHTTRTRADTMGLNILQLVLDLVGGLAVFLYGMEVMTER